MGNPASDRLLDYLYDVMYNSGHAGLDVSELPGDFRDFGAAFKLFAEKVIEGKMFALALSQGDLHCKVPPRNNELVAPLKSLHASLKDITWQTRQVAKGDYSRRMMFPGEFADAFNQMVQHLEERSVFETKERERLNDYISLILANTPDLLVVFDVAGRAVLASRAYIKSSPFSSASEIRGKTFAELFRAVTADGFLREMNDAFLHASRDKCAYVIRQSVDLRQDGMPGMYNIRVTPMLFEDDVVAGVMVILHALQVTR